MKYLTWIVTLFIVINSEAGDTCEAALSIENKYAVPVPGELKNKAIILQTFSNGQDKNSIIITQEGKSNNAYVIQSGQMNQSQLYQYGSENDGYQSTIGNENTLLLYQQGRRNWCRQEVIGNNNIVTDYQIGNNNIIEHVKSGNGNNCSIYQYGNNKEVRIIDRK